MRSITSTETADISVSDNTCRMLRAQINNKLYKIGTTKDKRFLLDQIQTELQKLTEQERQNLLLWLQNEIKNYCL